MTHILDKFACLVVEDEEPKLAAVMSALIDIDDTMVTHTAGSVASALDVIANQHIDLAIIDMSLPAFDFAKDMSGGGDPQDSGGRDILRFLEDEKQDAKAVILTMYQEFNLNDRRGQPQSLEKLSSELHEEFGRSLVSVIYYSGQRGPWKEELKSIITTIKEKKK